MNKETEAELSAMFGQSVLPADFQFFDDLEEPVVRPDPVTCANILDTAHEVERDGFNAARRRILSEARIVCALDKAASRPMWWWVNRLRHFDPNLPFADIAALSGAEERVIGALLGERIGTDVYAALPAISDYFERRKRRR